MLKGIRRLILERFHPASYLPMIFVFTLANGLYFKLPDKGFPLINFLGALLLMLSAFFRLRLFDEIKDYQVDLKINPTRPLARGIISISQVKKIIGLLIFLEILLTLSMGLDLFLIHTLAIVYSLLMYEEFFIGDWLSPKLTLYAVTHTISSSFLGISAAVFISQTITSNLAGNYVIFFIFNWAFFNLFEFARKTYSLNEERQGVDTYSSLYGPWGAAFLSFSQVIFGLLVIIYFLGTKLTFNLMCLSALYTVFLFLYALRPTQKNAKLLRTTTGIYLILFYSLLAWNLWRSYARH